MIYILMLSVLVLLIITMQLFNKDMTAPAFLITAAFTVSLLCCCIYADVWGFNDYRLILVILAGLIGFNIFSYITYILDKNGREPASYRFEPVAVNGYKLCIYLLFPAVISLFKYYIDNHRCNNIHKKCSPCSAEKRTCHSHKYINIYKYIILLSAYYIIYCKIYYIIDTRHIDNRTNINQTRTIHLFSAFTGIIILSNGIRHA